MARPNTPRTVYDSYRASLFPEAYATKVPLTIASSRRSVASTSNCSAEFTTRLDPILPKLRGSFSPLKGRQHNGTKEGAGALPRLRGCSALSSVGWAVPARRSSHSHFRSAPVWRTDSNHSEVAFCAKELCWGTTTAGEFVGKPGENSGVKNRGIAGTHGKRPGVRAVFCVFRVFRGQVFPMFWLGSQTPRPCSAPAARGH